MPVTSPEVVDHLLIAAVFYISFRIARPDAFAQVFDEGSSCGFLGVSRRVVIAGQCWFCGACLGCGFDSFSP
ncbi:hypothetical protein [Gordonia sp. FQ]|uniref:hypothetical protein n=1 Tax=Gordonia sp. FQ TaxID=3446634 RepID=UPI003F848F1A